MAQIKGYDKDLAYIFDKQQLEANPIRKIAERVVGPISNPVANFVIDMLSPNLSDILSGGFAGSFQDITKTLKGLASDMRLANSEREADAVIRAVADQLSDIFYKDFGPLAPPVKVNPDVLGVSVLAPKEFNRIMEGIYHGLDDVAQRTPEVLTDTGVRNLDLFGRKGTRHQLAYTTNESYFLDPKVGIYSPNQPRMTALEDFATGRSNYMPGFMNKINNTQMGVTDYPLRALLNGGNPEVIYNALRHAIPHEFGHAMWDQLPGDALRTRWVDDFWKTSDTFQDIARDPEKYKAVMPVVNSVAKGRPSLDLYKPIFSQGIPYTSYGMTGPAEDFAETAAGLTGVNRAKFTGSRAGIPRAHAYWDLLDLFTTNAQRNPTGIKSPVEDYIPGISFMPLLDPVRKTKAK